VKIRVYYEDTDAGGIVYHSNYLNYCERARSEIFFKKGMSPIIDDAHFVVRKMDCDFIRSAKFGDLLSIETKLVKFKFTSFLLEQVIKIDDKIIFKAKVLLVLVKNGKPIRINTNIKELLNQ